MKKFLEYTAVFHITYVYSMANLDRLDLPPAEAEKNIPASIRNPERAGIPVYFIDTVLSLALDTLVLPYTVYKQIDEGSIKVN